ncbi:tRNA lysidine(34) synthetase TilS, partial [Chlamydiota bacterium]
KKEKDMFKPLGAPGKRSLKNIFIDEKIPVPIRKAIPIIVNKNRIIYIFGYRISDEVKITNNTKKILKVSISYTVSSPC